MEDKIMKTTNQKQDAFIASLMPDSDKRMVRIASASLVVALMLGFWASTYEALIGEVMFEPAPESPTITTTMKIDEPLKEEKKVEKKRPPKNQNVYRKKPGGGGKPKGKGNPKAALERGVLKILTALKNDPSASAFDNVKVTLAKDIDKVISRVNGLKTHGTAKLGERRGPVNAGFNDGLASGGTGGITDLFGGMMGGSAGRLATSGLKGHISTPKPNQIDMGSGGGSRSAADIMKVVRQRTPGLRHIYNKHLKKKPGFQGKVTLKFTIAPGGEIISMAVVGSTTGYPEFDIEVKKAVSGWTFGKVKSGNTTVTIPFTFTE